MELLFYRLFLSLKSKMYISDAFTETFFYVIVRSSLYDEQNFILFLQIKFF